MKLNTFHEVGTPGILYAIRYFLTQCDSYVLPDGSLTDLDYNFGLLRMLI